MAVFAIKQYLDELKEEIAACKLENIPKLIAFLLHKAKPGMTFIDAPPPGLPLMRAFVSELSKLFC